MKIHIVSDGRGLFFRGVIQDSDGKISFIAHPSEVSPPRAPDTFFLNAKAEPNDSGGSRLEKSSEI
jgi:hypothetical protein